MSKLSDVIRLSITEEQLRVVVEALRGVTALPAAGSELLAILNGLAGTGGPAGAQALVAVGRKSGPCTDLEASCVFRTEEVDTVRDAVAMINAVTGNKEGWYVRVDGGEGFVTVCSRVTREPPAPVSEKERKWGSG